MPSPYERHLIVTYLANTAARLHHRDREAASLAEWMADSDNRSAYESKSLFNRLVRAGIEPEEGLSARQLRCLRQALREALSAEKRTKYDRPAQRLRCLGDPQALRLQGRARLPLAGASRGGLPHLFRPHAAGGNRDAYTMHAAKGLEWPIVVPINTITRMMGPDSAITDRANGRFYCPVFGVEPTGCAAAHEDEKAELRRERVRLWYVATSRAREILVLPRLDVAAAGSAWLSVVDLGLDALPALNLEHVPPEMDTGEPAAENEHTREAFATEAAAIAARQHSIVWRAPSRDEDTAQPVLREEAPTILATDGDGAPADGTAAATIQGGRERGAILHKLIEEVLTGETAEAQPALSARAEALIHALGLPVTDDPARGLAPAELAGCVVRALSLPEVAALRPSLVPELPVYASTATDTYEEATAGIVDAIAFDTDGNPDVVIDWKSDVDPSLETLEHYRAQVRAYLDMTGAERGLIVAVTTGAVMEVA